MSEYQYYEFVAVDRTLTEAQQDELRAVSTRGRITPSSFVNDYQWGDFKGDPRAWMERYFDAFLYLANWGTRRIALRLPIGVLHPDTAAEYCVGESASSWATPTHVIVDLQSEDEDGDAWWESEGTLASIVPVRADVAAGDHRLLYLAWLLCVHGRELDDDEPEPPVPPGLGSLSGPLRALVDFLRLDPDLLAAAAEASKPLQDTPPPPATLSRWVRALPETEKDTIVLRLMRGDDPQLRAELLRLFRGTTADRAAATGGRTAGELLAAAEARWAERQRLAQKREAANRKRQADAAAAAREERLNTLIGRQEQAWQQIDTMIDTKKPKEYDAAVGILQDLQAVAERERATDVFNGRLRRLREQHARKPSLLDRFDRARLF